ncbi:ABC-type sugar transport system, permease component [Treponema sp. JC4]|uniref:carbohydrate ABC transporter permease n=1 Tax=Treponema sp. JC4 TaxID=1124982 RepID=UPI00025B09D1|nr:sugar ABC transporter permease [Treponema sp. JC4]EID86199.1 ABC-type sugar transport system, permease component [Treponema sp. JC4]
MANEKVKKTRKINYNNWGYFFIAPFFVVFIIFQLIPLISTIGNSFFENYRVGLMQVGPTFNGLANFKTVLFESDVPRYAMNTLIMWILGFVPQIILSLLLSIWFTDTELSLKHTQFFKTVIYMPNLIMASAFAMLFFVIFADGGPVNSILMNMNLINDPIRFLVKTKSVRGLVAFMNCLMWYGNTTLLLMSGIMGIDNSIFEAARIDGANPVQVFFKVTLPQLAPILVYVVITSLIGGIQMFDVPQILTNGEGTPNRTSMTLIMYLNKHLFSKNYGLGGAVSVILFAITAALSGIVYKFNMQSYKRGR